MVAAPKAFVTPEEIAVRQKWVDQNNKALSAIMLNVSMEVAVGLAKYDKASKI